MKIIDDQRSCLDEMIKCSDGQNGDSESDSRFTRLQDLE